MQGGASDRLNWWQTRWFVFAAAVLAAIPLVWPAIPPLVDLPGHMGRFRVQQSLDEVPWLGDWFTFEWQLIGNLGVDLLIVALEPVFGVELATKLIVLAIPPLTAVGLLWIAREVHGRIPPTALFALPLVYAYPFHFGFVNFALSMALALNAFALWLRLARLGRIRLRGVLMVPIAFVIWITHTFGWGTLGVLAFSAELIRQHDRGENWIMAWVRAGVHCLVLAPPALLMILWRTGHSSGQTADWFNVRAKVMWLLMVLRDRWELFDLASVAVLWLVLMKGVRDPAIEYSRNLAISTLFLIAVYILLPRIVFGSAYADMRLAPYLFAFALISLRPRAGLSMHHAGMIALAGLAFFLMRTGATTWSFLLYDWSYKKELKALEVLPVGARVVSFVGMPCRNQWYTSRLHHIPGIGLVRNYAYSNDQWSMLGGQLLTTRYEIARGFSHDPSQIVTQDKCRGEYWRPIDRALELTPRHAFDYVWLIDPPRYDPALTRGMTAVWRGGTSALYRIDDRTPVSVSETPSADRP